MIISTKGEYALRVMTELAGLEKGERLPLKEIAQHQNISLKYLESIMALLSRNNLVEAASGKGGGYSLIRDADQYSLLEILNVTDGDLAPVSCNAVTGDGCDRLTGCPTYPVWRELSELIAGYLGGKTLNDLRGISNDT